MAHISIVGRRDWRVRLLIGAMYVILALGALSMLLPFTLMVSLSTTSKADYVDFRLLPTYWYDDASLFKKYVLDISPLGPGGNLGGPGDYPAPEELATWFGADNWFSSRDVKPESLAPLLAMPKDEREAMAADVREFIGHVAPAEFRLPIFARDPDSPLALHDEYRAWLIDRYQQLGIVAKLYDLPRIQSWDEVRPPGEQAQRKPNLGDVRVRDWRDFLGQLTPDRVTLYNANRDVFIYLRTKTIPASYEGPRNPGSTTPNRSLVTYEDLLAGRLGPELKEDFFRTRAPTRYVKIDVQKALPSWRDYLRKRGRDPRIALTERVPDSTAMASLWALFANKFCPIDALSLVRPEPLWQNYLTAKYHTLEGLNAAWGSDFANWPSVRIPYEVLHVDHFLAIKSALRWQYLTHNYRTVLAHIALHGHALWVTLVYIALSIFAALSVNPLAAYALARFQLRETNYILIFLLATMAFPGEVLMIPNFLQIKSFPLLQIAMVMGVLLFFVLLQMLLGKRLGVKPWVSATIAVAVSGWVAGWLLPQMAAAADISLSVSLMNTFWALILPGLANGYGIFLLKGFFDGLPPELYEAGLLDGANEWQLFWNVTIPMSMPILAITVLNSFTGAYGAFMHAFLVCQDPAMWTLMVFLYEFQQSHSPPMVMASLVISSIPTLVVFLVCQKIIMRGIVIPSFK